MDKQDRGLAEENRFLVRGAETCTLLEAAAVLAIEADDRSVNCKSGRAMLASLT
jgi:hypothetical protein